MPEKEGSQLRTIDQEILELMLDGRDDDGPWGFTTPSLVAKIESFSNEYATNRLSMLHAGGLVTKPTKGLYVLTQSEINVAERDES